MRVVVIDDNRDAADTLALVLQLKGCDVRVAYDGAARLAAALECATDCVISDIGMPGMDGYAVVRGVRRHPSLAGVKLVALSAFSHEDHARKAREAGVDYQVTKSSSLTDSEVVLRTIEDIKSPARRGVELAGEPRDPLTEVKQEVRERKEDRETAGGRSRSWTGAGRGSSDAHSPNESSRPQPARSAGPPPAAATTPTRRK